MYHISGPHAINQRGYCNHPCLEHPWVAAHPSAFLFCKIIYATKTDILTAYTDGCNHFNFPLASTRLAFRKVLPTYLAPFKLVIIKVRDLPEKDFPLLSRDKDKPDPYVRIRFTEIETGKVF